MSGGTAKDFVRKVKKIGAETCDGDLAARCVLKAFRQIGRGLSVTTSQLPEVAYRRRSSGSHRLAPFV